MGGSLKWLDLQNCCNLQTLPENIGLLSSLQELNLSGSNVESLPASIRNLLMLRRLHLDSCMKLVSLPKLPQFLLFFSAANCISLVTNFTQLNISFYLKQGLEKPIYFFLPGAHVPDWFSFHAEGASVTVPHLPYAGLSGFVFCLVLSRSPPRRYIECEIYKNSERIAGTRTSVDARRLFLDHLLLWFVNITKGGEDIHKRIQEGGVCYPCNIRFEFFLEDKGETWTMEGIKGCGVYPIYASTHGYTFKQKWLDFVCGDSSEDIVELKPNSCSTNINELQVKESNHCNEDDQTKKLQQVIPPVITTSTCVQHEKVDSNESSSCHSFIVSTAGGTKRKPQSFEDGYCIASIPENQIISSDTPSASNIESNQIIEVLEEKDLTNNHVDKCSEPLMFEKLHALVENDNQHLELDGDPLAELESMLCDSYNSFPMSALSTTVSETEIQVPNVTAILEKLETLLEASLETLSSDDEVKQQFHQVLNQLVQFEDQVPVKLHPITSELRTFIESVDVRFVTAQKSILHYDQLLQSRSLLSKHLESVKARHCQINSKVTEGKIQFEKINSEIFELEQKISVLVETRDDLKRDLDNCEVENNKLKIEVAKWVPECKTVITALKDSKTSYKVALINKKNAEDEWADLKKTFVAKRFD